VCELTARHAGRVEDLEHRTVAQPERRGDVGLREDPIRFVRARVRAPVVFRHVEGSGGANIFREIQAPGCGNS
jgi:hypothetical protein